MMAQDLATRFNLHDEGDRQQHWFVEFYAALPAIEPFCWHYAATEIEAKAFADSVRGKSDHSYAHILYRNEHVSRYY
jgi:hypothetical protein